MSPITALYEAGLPFARVPPGRVREFARAIGQLAKTDRLDARLLAEFAEKIKPPATRLPGAAALGIDDPSPPGH